MTDQYTGNHTPKNWDLVADYYDLNPGGHFFDRNTMKFFSSRLGSQWYRRKDGAYVFITSERDTMATTYQPRAFTVRVLDRSGWIETVGDFNSYTRSVAERMGRQLATQGWTLGPAPNGLQSLRERYEIPAGGLYHPDEYKALRKRYPDTRTVSRRDINRLIRYQRGDPYRFAAPDVSTARWDDLAWSRVVTFNRR